MAFPRIGGQGIGLTNPLNNSLGAVLSAGNNAPFRSNIVSTQAGQNFLLPAGTLIIEPGQYTFLQYLDPVSQNWLTRDTSAESGRVIDSDGGNFRLANLSGCAIGALVTTASSALTNGIGTAATGLSVTPSAGASVWVPVVGGAIATTPTQVTAGTNYLYPPLVVIDAPPTGGIQATGISVLSAGGVASITMTNQGAGYTTAPNIAFVNDFRDGTGAGASFTAALTGSGTLTALYPSNAGTALTAVPTLTFSPTGPAATVIMNFTVTGGTVATAGAGYTVSSSVLVLSNGGQIAGTQVLTNPLIGTQITLPRMARLFVPTTAGGALTATGLIVTDGGIGFQAVPLGAVIDNGVVTTQGVVTLTVGGVNDFSYIQQI